MPRSGPSPLIQPLFSEPQFDEQGSPKPDPTTFRTAHNSALDNQTYSQIQSLLSKETVSFPQSTARPNDVYPLARALGSQGPADVAAISSSGKIVFHSIGDSGASIISKLPNELSVADHLTNDFHAMTGADRPAFLFHLGDIVYSFGESQYYYDQFYEPFRNYPAPIFAVPGNHDSFLVPGTSAANAPLTTFMRNFCSPKPVITHEAGSLHRTAMTQPGVYFALDAPFARIIGLFSNCLEDPGVISSQKGQGTKWPGVPDYQLNFLTAQLRRIKKEKYPGAVIVAFHHPPFVYSPSPASGGAGGHHTGNPSILNEIDALCQAQGVYPHAFLSGHSHNYQRFTRKLNLGKGKYEVPFVVAGNGGFNVKSILSPRGGVLPPEPAQGTDVSYLDSNPNSKGLVLEQYDGRHYGYLRATVDAKQLKIEYHPVSPASPPGQPDAVSVDIASHSLA